MIFASIWEDISPPNVSLMKVMFTCWYNIYGEINDAQYYFLKYVECMDNLMWEQCGAILFVF